MKNYYIFFTNNIHPIGGQQLYTLGKADFLEKQGWEVIVFNPSHPTGKCGFSGLDKYIKYGMVSLYCIPSELPEFVRNTIIRRLIRNCRIEKDAQEIFVESQYTQGSLWAELFAEKLNAKHIIFDVSEKFRGDAYYYEELIEFYKYKFKRKELYGISETSVKRLFDGFDIEMPDGQQFYFNAVEPEAVQDIHNAKIDLLKRLDYNIMYIGRGEKGYVPNIIKGVARFAKSNIEKSISFIVIGGMESRAYEMQELRECSNVTVNILGEMVPIPREIFGYADVVIAGAGCARLSSDEGIKTIIMDANTYNAVGVYGYDTKSVFFAEDCGQKQTCDYYLNKLLVDREYDNRECNLPEGKDLQKEIIHQLSFFEEDDSISEYYDVSKCIIKRKISKKKKMKCILSDIKSFLLRRNRIGMKK